MPVSELAGECRASQGVDPALLGLACTGSAPSSCDDSMLQPVRDEPASIRRLAFLPPVYRAHAPTPLS